MGEFHRNGWRNGPEWVGELKRNQWAVWNGISGRIGPESAHINKVTISDGDEPERVKTYAELLAAAIEIDLIDSHVKLSQLFKDKNSPDEKIKQQFLA